MLLAAVIPASLINAQTATVTIDASDVVRNVPSGLMGSNTGTGKSAKYWASLTPAYRADAMAARMSAVRITSYPEDTSNTANSITLEELDNRVAQVINSGAIPIFIQAINKPDLTYSDTRDAAVYAKYLTLDGEAYDSSSTATASERIATNMAYLVNRYKSAPFYLEHQYWEIGNEPDLSNVNYRVEDSAEYIADFHAIHDQLVALGLRSNVSLCGPVTSWDYGFGGYRDTLMNDFLAACADEVDVVTRHIYASIYSWENLPYTPYTLLNRTGETLHFNSDYVSTSGRGEGPLLAAMDANGLSSSVGTGVTEMNLFENGDGSDWRHTITQGLWFVLSDHYSLYNPRSLLTTGFKFDTYNNDLAYYQSDKSRSFPYWATYIHGALTGDQILNYTSTDSHIVITASMDDSYVYVLVMNRHDTDTYSATITLNNTPAVGAPTLFEFNETDTPDTGTATTYGTTFTHSFAPMSVSIFRYPRDDAPAAETPAEAPTTVHFTTDFDSAPDGMNIYYVGFEPTVSSGRLNLTYYTPTYSKSAVIFNGQPLTSATDRVQARFQFYVVHKNAEGFVFGAYSADPGAVGDGSQALGYQGQENRLWGVKVDNNPDEIGVVAGQVDDYVEGWATQALAPYYGQDMYAVIDYDGPAGTVRARLYVGTDDSGTLVADVTNAVGNPDTLPAGTVFGFTGATSNYTQTTYIKNLSILVDEPAAEVVGTSFTMQSWTSAPWNGTSGATSFSGTFTPDGESVTVTYANPKTGVDITTPASPDFSSAAASYFGFEGTGFGVGNSTVGRFDSGESFTMEATHDFVLQTIYWREFTGDEQVHISWTSHGLAKSALVSIVSAITTFDDIKPDANTLVTITNASPSTAYLLGRLRINYVIAAPLN